MKQFLKIISLLLPFLTLAGCSPSHRTFSVESQAIRPITCLGVTMGSLRFEKPAGNRYVDVIAEILATSATTEYLNENSIRHCHAPSGGGESPSHILVLNPLRGKMIKNPDRVREITYLAMLRDVASQKIVWRGSFTTYPRVGSSESTIRCTQLERVHSTLVFALTELRAQGFTFVPHAQSGEPKHGIQEVKCS